MQVNVFIVHEAGAERNRLLVLPASADASIPNHLQDDWRYFATVDSSDQILGGESAPVETEIASKGFMVINASI
jgi:hypothetical protein